MKQNTTPEQTAKLIELGFDMPKSIIYASAYQEEEGADPDVEYEYAYSIGELIEILLSKPHCRVSIYNVGLKQYKVLFKKLINRKFKVLFREVGYEPIDLLFNCIVNLKENF